MDARTLPPVIRLSPEDGVVIARIGLPPGPISNPGAASIDAAANPADGPWYFFVAVNPFTGETKYGTTLAEHEVNVAQLNAYCKAKPQDCGQ